MIPFSIYLVSTSYQSYFGSNVLKVDNKLTNYDLSFDYLLLNSEFEFDSDLNGFIINAIQPGNVHLSVIFNHISLNSVS